MAAPVQYSPAQPDQSSSADRRQNLTIEDMLRECIELCARVAEQHAAAEVAQSIRKLKPASRWP